MQTDALTIPLSWLVKNLAHFCYYIQGTLARVSRQRLNLTRRAEASLLESLQLAQSAPPPHAAARRAAAARTVPAAMTVVGSSKQRYATDIFGQFYKLFLMFKQQK